MQYAHRILTRGFTVVELMIVIGVIAILLSISISTYQQQQRAARTEKAQAISQTVLAGAENYYAKNGEYPVASTFTNLAVAASTLGTTQESLSESGVTLTPCTSVGTACNFSEGKVYYISRTSQSDTTDRSYSIGGCTIMLSGSSTTTSGVSSFFIAYFDSSTNKWKFTKSIKGTATISGTSCQFS